MLLVLYRCFVVTGCHQHETEASGGVKALGGTSQGGVLSRGGRPAARLAHVHRQGVRRDTTHSSLNDHSTIILLGRPHAYILNYEHPPAQANPPEFHLGFCFPSFTSPVHMGLMGFTHSYLVGVTGGSAVHFCFMQFVALALTSTITEVMLSHQSCRIVLVVYPLELCFLTTYHPVCYLSNAAKLGLSPGPRSVPNTLLVGLAGVLGYAFSFSD